MATRVRTFNQLDEFATNTVVNSYLSHNNCLIVEPTLSLDFSQGKLILSWTNFSALVGGTVKNVSAGNYAVDNGSLPVTTVYCYYKPSENENRISFSYDNLPSGDYALVATIRYKTQDGVVVYFVNPENNSIDKSLSKIETRFWLDRPKYIGGIRPITLDGNGYLSTSEGLAIYGKELITIPAITNGKILLDNETVIDKLTDITTYLDDTAIPDGAFVGINVAINIFGIDYNKPFLATRMRNAPYYTLNNCIEDKFGAIQSGFPIISYFNTYMPLGIFVFRKGFFGERCFINLLDSYFENKNINQEMKRFDEVALTTIVNDDFDNIQPQLRYDTISTNNLVIGQTKSCIEVTLQSNAAFGFGGITPSTEANGNYDMTDFICHFKLTNNVNTMPLVGWVNPSNPNEHLLIAVDSGYFRIMRNGSYILNTSNTQFSYNTNYFMRIAINGGKLTSSVCKYVSRGDITTYLETFNENGSVTIDNNADYVPFVGVMNYDTCLEYPKFLCDFLIAKRLRPVI